MAIHANGTIFAGTWDDGVFSSSNNGASWTQTGLTNYSVSSLAINANGTIFAGTEDGGVFSSSNNGASWTQVNSGLTNTTVLSLAIHANGTLFAGTLDGGVFRSKTPTVTPSLTSPANGATGVSVSTALTWSTVSGATGYDAQVFAGSSCSGTLLASLSNQNVTTWSPSGLANNTQYCWQVRSLNAGGSSPWTSRTFTTLALAKVNLSTPVSASLINGSTASLQWQIAQGATGYQVQIQPSNSFTDTVPTPVGTSSTSFSATNLNINFLYYWRVRAVSGNNFGPWSDTWSLYTYPQTITHATSKTFSDITSSNSYRMVGIPGVGFAIAGTLTGVEGTDWACYTPPYINNTYAKCGSTFEAGKGYWLVSKNNWRVNGNTSSVALSQVKLYAIPLSNGWNMISNPFNLGVSWATVLDRSQISGSIYGFTGSTFQTSSTLQPYEGYFYYNQQAALTNLLVPYPFSGAEVMTKTEIERPESLVISAENASGDRVAIRTGWHAKASVALDPLDDFVPPTHFSALALRILNDHLETDYKWLAQDFRPDLASGVTYPIALFVNKSGEIQLSIQNKKLLGMFNALLIDPIAKKTYRLDENTPTKLMLPAGERLFQLMIAPESALIETEQTYLPKELGFSGNYPNPFTHQTTIGFALPTKQVVKLTIFDLNGRIVRMLINEELPAGNHEFLWDGKLSSGQTAPTGTYLLRLEASKQHLIRKMVLVK